MSTIKVSQNYKVQVFTWIHNASETNCTETFPTKQFRLFTALSTQLCATHDVLGAELQHPNEVFSSKCNACTTCRTL